MVVGFLENLLAGYDRPRRSFAGVGIWLVVEDEIVKSFERFQWSLNHDKIVARPEWLLCLLLHRLTKPRISVLISQELKY